MCIYIYACIHICIYMRVCGIDTHTHSMTSQKPSYANLF